MRKIESMDLIYRDPKIRRGRPCIVGPGLRVFDIVTHQLYWENNPEKIASAYGIGLAEVYAALAYYHLNKDEIDAHIEEHKLLHEKVEELGFETAIDWFLLRRKPGSDGRGAFSTPHPAPLQSFGEGRKTPKTIGALEEKPRAEASARDCQS